MIMQSMVLRHIGVIKSLGRKVAKIMLCLPKSLPGLDRFSIWRDELTDNQDIADIFKNEIFKDTIYVMTPEWLGNIAAQGLRL